MAFERGLQQRDLPRRQIEEPIDNGVDLAFGGENGVRERLDPRAVFGKIGFPFGALLERDFRAKSALDLGAEGFEVEFVPVVEFSGEFRAVGGAEIENAAADGGLNLEAFARRVGAALAKRGEAPTCLEIDFRH